MFIPLLTLTIIVILLGFTALTGAPYVPTHQAELDQVFTKLRPLTQRDFLLDLGAGDGRVLLAAARHGAGGLGLELSPLVALAARLRIRRFRRTHPDAPPLQLKCQNFYHIQFPPQTTVVYIFADSRDIGKIHRKIQSEATRLCRPLHVISYGFEFPGQAPLKSHRAHHLYLIQPEEGTTKK